MTECHGSSWITYKQSRKRNTYNNIGYSDIFAKVLSIFIGLIKRPIWSSKQNYIRLIFTLIPILW